MSRCPRWFTSLLCAMALAGCARRLPHGVAERYLENLQQFNYPACYELLSQDDHRDRALPEFLTEIPLAPDASPVWFRPLLHLTHYQLGAEERGANGLTATVPVRITAPDLPRWERSLNAAVGRGGVTTDAAQASLDRGNYPRWIYDDRIFLVKEHHRWRVVAGFAARDRIVDRHRQAMNDYFALRYDQAIAEWRSMIDDLSHQEGTGSTGLAARYSQELGRMERLRASRGEMDQYMAMLKLKNVAMKMSEDRVPAIFGDVSNTGDRPVDILILSVTWYEGRGKDLKQVDHEEHPIIITPLEFTDFTAPVAPLMPGESRPFGFTLSVAPAVQQVASPYVTISQLAFGDGALAKAAGPFVRSATATPSATSSPSDHHQP
ncbi:MAG TPA: hypothetical protein VKS22_00775 [Candidatus Binataceae bacterium]|nr:hypothetical protein [Candidatus Binataceae bacterium]